MPVPAPTPPISYSRQVAPVLALHCYSCHGDSGGLNLRTHQDLMLGGNLGKVILAGNPDGSLLVHFIEGRRGPTHRMPQGGQPLLPQQIQTIRQWISQGAKQDRYPSPRYVRTLAPMPLGPSQMLRVRCRLSTAAYVTLTARNPLTRQLLFSESATIKSPKDKGDAGVPGQPLIWELRSGAGWPKAVVVELVVEYSAGDPKKTEFSAELADRR